MGHKKWSLIKRLKGVPTPPEPPIFPFGTVLQHKNTSEPVNMNVLKGMVLGPAEDNPDVKVKILRLSGLFKGQMADVYAVSWEPADAEA